MKTQWNDKRTELLKHAKDYVGGNDAEYISDYRQELDELSGELKATGKEYYQEVDWIA